MRKKHTAIILIIAMVMTLFPLVSVYAATLTVGTGGTYSTLSAALAATANGDTITVLSNVTEVSNYEFDTTGKTVTIDGGGHTVTGFSNPNDSVALSLKGTGTVKLKDLTLQGGTATDSSQVSTGLKASDSVNVQSTGTVNSYGGASDDGNSYGLWNTGSGTVNVTSATGGTADNISVGVYTEGGGTVNVVNATGGTGLHNPSAGVWNTASGTVNATNAIGGDSITNHSYGVVSELTGTVNVTNATGVDTTSVFDGIGVRGYNGGTVNVTNATGSTTPSCYSVDNPAGTLTVNASTLTGSTLGTVNTGAAITTLTLNKGTGADCVLDSITIASAGNTKVGALPQVYKNGVQGTWYTDAAGTVPFVGTTVNSTTTLYSTFYAATYTMTAIADQTLTAVTAGYGAGTQETKTLTIARTGTGDLASLATALSGANAGSFTITQPAATTLNNATPNTTFTVKANDGLATGTYTATVTVSATVMTDVTFTVTQVVNAASGGGHGHSSNSGGTAADPVKTTVDSGEDVKVENLSKIVSEGEKLTVKSDLGTVVFDTAALSAIDSQTTEKITVVIEKAPDEKLSDEQKALVGDRPVYDLTVLSGGKQISDFNGGKVTVTLPYELREGEEPGGVVVWYLADDGTLTPITCTYDEKAKAATFTVTHFSQYVVGYDTAYDAAWTNPFTDVAAGAWYYESIGFAYQNELMLGKSETSFAPNGSTTRSMIVSILWRLEGQPEAAATNGFKDVNASAWYSDAVAWALENGIVSGYATGTFGPENKITREQLASILYRYANWKGLDVTKKADLSGFSDAAKISDWADNALAYANAEGLISGVNATTLNPGGEASRAQVAVILKRFIENTEE